MFKFEILHRSKKSGARVGRIHTPHGIIDTPNFVPVATNGTIKAADSVLLEEANIQLMFCNTYHLLLHPGPEVVARAGGLHTFMRRNAPLITDSGGFQVFSLAYGGVHSELKSSGKKRDSGSVLKITEEGVLFRSYRDGEKVLLTPETSVQAQKALGADIIIPLDELPPYHITQHALKKSLERTHRWEKRSLEEHKKDERGQAMYAVVHGGIDDAMRKQSVDFLNNLPFDGYAIGGSVGKNSAEMLVMLKNLMPHMRQDAPNHLLGIGDIPSIHAAIPLGIDTFDSSHPTKCARHGLIFTKQGQIKILQTQYKMSMEPLEEGCACYVCKNYSRAYVHHLFKAHEMTAYTLATVHNIYYMMQLMQTYRMQILHDEI